MTKRMFLAIEPPATVREALAGIRFDLRGVNWQDPEHTHLTLAFLGDVDAVQRERLESELHEVRVPSFVLPVRGVGTFGRDRPSVIWAGVGPGHPHLFALHQHVINAALAAGIEADLRSWKPHLTLARCRGVSAQSLRPFLRRHEDHDFGLIRVDHFALFSSRLRPGGSVHTIERTWPLVD